MLRTLSPSNGLEAYIKMFGYCCIFKTLSKREPVTSSQLGLQGRRQEGGAVIRPLRITWR
jgi:hypothetical protein